MTCSEQAGQCKARVKLSRRPGQGPVSQMDDRARVCRRAACERFFRPRRRNQVYCSPRCREAAKNHRWRLVRVNSAERRSLQRLRARHAAKNKRCNTASRMLERETFRQAALWLARRLSGDRTTELDLSSAGTAAGAETNAAI
jgi:hypothetical protein